MSATADKAGYALPLTLAALAAAALIVLAILPALADIAGAARAERDEALFLRRAADAEAWTAYLAATGQLTQDRLRFAPDAPGIAIRLDGRAYAWRGLTLSLQDEGGLFNLNTADDRALRRLFVQGGVSQADAVALADQLLDYRDGDRLARARGAERPRYLALGRPPPPDAPLPDPGLVQGLADWPAGTGLWSRLDGLVTVGDRGEVNLDTAPAEVLRSALGLSDSAAAAIIRKRELRPFYGRERPAMAAGPGRARLRLIVEDSASGRARQVTLELSPRADSPFRPLTQRRLLKRKMEAHAAFPELR